MDTIHSTWGDWFVREEIEAAEPDGLSLWYLGCNGFVLRTPETTLYVDPYFGPGDPPFVFRMIPIPMDPADATTCDAVLVTHEHIDHMHHPSFAPLVDECGADVYASHVSFDDPDYQSDYDVPGDHATVVEPGDQYEFDDLTVHVREANDPDAAGDVAYVFEHDAGTYVNTGDSRPADAFDEIGQEFDVDLASVTFGTVGRIYDPETGTSRPTRWYNDENQVVEIANALQADRLLPCHYDMWKAVGADPKLLHEHAASFRYPRTIDVVEIGDRVRIDEPGIVPMRALDG